MNDVENNPDTRNRLDALKQALASLGWIEGRNLHIDYRPITSDPGRLRAAAAELVGLMPDVIYTSGSSGLRPLHQATSAIPIVFARALDPVAEGYVSSLARPGGNMTGFAAFDAPLGPRWLQLLKQAAPNVTHAGILYDPANVGVERLVNSATTAAPALGLQATALAVHNSADIERAVESVAKVPNGGLCVHGNTAIIPNYEMVAALTSRHRIPTIGVRRSFAERGGLISYGPVDLDEDRLAASYVDRILKGAKPADLPVQYPTKYELVINLKIARTIGLEIAPAFLSVADELIE